MGFWGTFVACRSDQQLGQLLPDVTAAGEADACDGRWSGGWRVWRLFDSSGELPTDVGNRLVRATGGPVLIGRVLDSDAVQVTGIGVRTANWQTWLKLDSALGTPDAGAGTL